MLPVTSKKLYLGLPTEFYQIQLNFSINSNSFVFSFLQKNRKTKDILYFLRIIFLVVYREKVFIIFTQQRLTRIPYTIIT